jgi:hypothetical protein
MEPIWQNKDVIRHSILLAQSYRRFTEKELLPDAFAECELARRLYEAPFVLLSHGTQLDPVLNYGNATALRLWEMSWEEFTRTPSRLTAEAPLREARARLLAVVTAQGFIDDYSGIRVSRTGRRFQVAQATVWNLITPDGKACGQAAMFTDWRFIED